MDFIRKYIVNSDSTEDISTPSLLKFLILLRNRESNPLNSDRKMHSIRSAYWTYNLMQYSIVAMAVSKYHLSDKVG